MPGRLDDKARLGHILIAIQEMDVFLAGVDWEIFVRNVPLRHASARELEIIGEAANYVSKDFQAQFPEIQWRQLVGLRNLIVHQYFGIDYRTVWEIIQDDLRF